MSLGGVRSAGNLPPNRARSLGPPFLRGVKEDCAEAVTLRSIAEVRAVKDFVAVQWSILGILCPLFASSLLVGLNT